MVPDALGVPHFPLCPRLLWLACCVLGAPPGCDRSCFDLLARDAFEQRRLPYRSADCAPGGSVPVVLASVARAGTLRIRSPASSFAGRSKTQSQSERTNKREETRYLSNVQKQKQQTSGEGL